MYYLPPTSSTNESPLNFDALHAYYQAQGCTEYSETSLVDTLNAFTFSAAETKDAEQQDEPAVLEETHLHAFTQALIGASHQNTANTQSLEELVANVDSENETVNRMAIQLWIERFRSMLAEEESPLVILTSFPQLCDTPIQMCAALCVLAEQATNANVAEILQSGLLQDYARRHLFEVPALIKTYALFESHIFTNPTEQAFQKNLLEALPTIPIVSESGEKYEGLGPHGIHGGLIPVNQSSELATAVKPPFDWHIDTDRLRSLLTRLGIDIIIEAISQSYNDEVSSQLKTSLSAVIAELGAQDIGELYTRVNTQVSEEHYTRFDFLTRFSGFVSAEQALTAVRESSVSPWVILSLKPNLISQFTPEDLDKIRQSLSIGSEHPFVAANDVKVAFKAAEHDDCDPALRDEILLGIADAWLHSPHDLSLIVNINHVLIRSNVIQAWVLEKTAAYRSQWEAVLQGKISPLTPESFREIIAEAQDLRLCARARQLQTISDGPIDLPFTTYQLAAAVLTAALENYVQSPLTDSEDEDDILDVRIEQVEQLFSIIAPVEEFDGEPRFPDEVHGCTRTTQYDELAKTHILFEAVCKTGDAACFAILITRPFRYHLARILTPDNIIKAHVLLNETQFDKLHALRFMDLSRAMKNSIQLRETLQALDPDKCIVLLDKLVQTRRLMTLIDSDSSLNAVMTGLSDTKRDEVFKRLSEDLSTLYKFACSLDVTFSLLNEEHRDIVLSRLSVSALERCITVGEHLGNVLQHLNPRQAEQLLDSIKPRLPTILRKGYNKDSYVALISQKVQEVNPRYKGLLFDDAMSVDSSANEYAKGRSKQDATTP